MKNGWVWLAAGMIACGDLPEADDNVVWDVEDAPVEVPLAVAQGSSNLLVAALCRSYDDLGPYIYLDAVSDAVLCADAETALTFTFDRATNTRTVSAGRFEDEAVTFQSVSTGPIRDDGGAPIVDGLPDASEIGLDSSAADLTFRFDGEIFTLTRFVLD
jgi:hypothetical protein